MKANICLMLLLGALALSACTIGAPARPPENASICSEPGTIGREKIPHPTQGFNIAFQYYLPPCYEKSEISRFPVIYLIAVPFERRLDATENSPMSLADRLIRAGKIPPAILVVPDLPLPSVITPRLRLILFRMLMANSTPSRSGSIEALEVFHMVRQSPRAWLSNSPRSLAA